MLTADPPGTFRFGDFELDAGAYELRRNGRPVRIERQPMDLLLLLVQRRRQLVPRSEIVDTLWGKDVFVDVETGVHTAIRKIRRALDDSADAPRFVETVSGKGYRFIATVEVVPAPHDATASGKTQWPVAPRLPDSVLSEPRPAEATTLSLGEASLGSERVVLWTPLETAAPATAANPVKLGAAGASAPRIRLALGLALAALVIGVGNWSRLPRNGSSRSSQLTLAVLPFANLSGDPAREYLAEGLGEETAASIGQIDPTQMNVVARTSTLRYKGTTKSAAEIGRELGADYLVESSVRAEDSRLRVTSTLVRVRDQVQVWSQSYDREPTSVLGLQRELSRAIAEQVRLRLSPGRLEAMARRQTGSPEAFDLYLRGRNFENQRTPATNRQAIVYYTRATELDPDYALAWSAVARVLAGSLSNGDASPAEALPRAREAAARAVQSGPDTAEAQFALAYLKWCCEWDWPGAEAGFRRAVALDPRLAIGHLWLGHALSQMGRHGEALLSTGRARDLEPLSALMPALSSQVAFQSRDYRAALDHARQAIVLDPEFWIGHMMRGAALEQLGEYASALEALTTAARFSGENSKALSLRAYVLAGTGQVGEARAMLQTLEGVSKSQHVPPYAMALINAGLRDRDAVFAWLERAYDVRDVHLIYLPVDPKWDSYRAGPRFEALVARRGFRRTASLASSR
ncbi:MAG: winged helix-turn-helix domain-containing protein [Acidobacteriota bacterium]|nr:winged helix-turn-helix domain-containing protein [Acidobacteriota bacterium]